MKKIKKNLLKNISGDLLYSIAAMSVLNGVIQIVVYPFFNKYMGASDAGLVISLMSVVAMTAASFGSSANYSRLIRRMHYEVSSGDYNIFLFISCGLCVVISTITMMLLYHFSMSFFVLFSILLMVSVLRYYGDVEFRITLNYKGYFIYYLLIAVGYVIGLGIYMITYNWMIGIILGELLALTFVYFQGSIFRPFILKKSVKFSSNIKSMSTLTGSNLLTTIASNVDRVLIAGFVSTYAVTVFHASCIMGRVISLLTVPLNSVLIGYITRYNGEIKRRHFMLIGFVFLGIGLVMTVICVFSSWIFVKMLYDSVFYDARQYFMIANAGQIFYFISSSYILILLRFTSEAYQLGINAIYLVVFLLLSIPAIICFGLSGLIYAIMVANVLKFLGIFIVGMLKIKK